MWCSVSDFVWGRRLGVWRRRLGREGKEEENQKRAVDGHANGSVVSGRCPPTANGTQNPACWEPGSVFVDDLEVCTLYLYLDLCMRIIIIGVSRVSYLSLWAPTLVTSDQALRRLHAARHGRLGRGVWRGLLNIIWCTRVPTRKQNWTNTVLFNC